MKITRNFLQKDSRALAATYTVGLVVLFGAVFLLLSSMIDQYPIFFALGFALTSTAFSLHFNFLRTKKLQKTFEDEIQIRESSAKEKIARQVAHDIRSPLSALNMIISTLDQLPEDKRLIIRNATQRINDITNSLMQKNSLENNKEHSQIKISPDRLRPVMLVSLVDQVLSEKRVQFRNRMNIDIQADLSSAYGLFAKIHSLELSKVISNLIDNSVGAITENNGKIQIGLKAIKDKIYLTIEDNGPGISAESLSLIHSNHRDHSNAKGGINQARSVMHQAGGELRITSYPKVGTRIELVFPQAQPPSWFLDKIRLYKNTVLITVDDDQTIHQIWDDRLRSLEGDSKEHITYVSLSSIAGLRKWLQQYTIEPDYLFLIDFEFIGEDENGLGAIESLNLTKQCALVTSRYDEPNVKIRAEEIGLKLIPKGLAGFIPIELLPPKKLVDAILIDDDSLVHMTWDIAAQSAGKTLESFFDPEDFLRRAQEYDPCNSIYIDVNLGRNVDGTAIAKKLYELGFKKLVLSTGYDPDSLAPSHYVSQIIGKEPPF